MKRNMDSPMTDFDGNAFADKSTLRTVAFTVLSSPLEGDDKVPVEQKMKQFALLQTIYKGGVVDLSAEDISLLKTRAAKLLSLMAMGTFCEMLEKDIPAHIESIAAKKKAG